MKDNFSAQAALYAGFRPHYPEAMYNFLYGQVKNFDKALDVATGNGQVATVLAAKFHEVFATDISEKQLAQAPAAVNIYYRVEPAEKTMFVDESFGLVTVGQAIHWFNFDTFYGEVKRLLKPGGIIAIIGYGLVRINDEVDKWIDDYYWNIVGPYWDKERKYIDEEYATIPFPFNEIETPKLSIDYTWSKEQFIGYLHTWSAFQHYVKANGNSPLSAKLVAALGEVWKHGEALNIRFPLFLRVGLKGG